jgi:hypothetical protein
MHQAVSAPRSHTLGYTSTEFSIGVTGFVLCVSALVCDEKHTSAYVCIRLHTSAYVSVDGVLCFVRVSVGMR